MSKIDIDIVSAKKVKGYENQFFANIARLVTRRLIKVTITIVYHPIFYIKCDLHFSVRLTLFVVERRECDYNYDYALLSAPPLR